MRAAGRPFLALLAFCAALACLSPARAQLPTWSEDAQKKWFLTNLTLKDQATSASVLQRQLALAYGKNGATAFSQPDFQNWLDLVEWIKVGLDAGSLLDDPAYFQAFVALGNDEAVSHLFVEKIEPADSRPGALGVLIKLERDNAADLHEYAALGNAFALVFDVPFPDDWPHAQVARRAVPIGDTDPVTRFRFYVASNRAHRCELDLAQQNFEALKFVVDSEINLAELAYGQQQKTPYSQFVSAFFSINYMTLRVSGNSEYDWPLSNYRLQDIENAGGICVDQAYYAAMVGKARGIPTVMLSGMGDAGGHAWFGYLDKSGAWQLDCGRYESQNYAKGYTRDPQTWEELKDTDWQQFVKNGVRDSNYTAARTALRWARLQGATPQAWVAYEDVHTLMPAYAEAWTAEADFLDKSNASIDDQKAFYQQWIAQMAPFPDQKVAAQRRLVAALRKANDPTAENVEQDIVLQNRTGGIDLAIDGAVDSIEDHASLGDWDGARMEFERSVRDFAEKGGGTFFYRLLDPYIRNCWSHGQVPQARNGLHFTEERDSFVLADRHGSSVITQDFDKMKSTQADIEVAVDAMQKWLAELDEGQADQAWSEALPTLQANAKDIAAVRQKAGSLNARTLMGVSRHERWTGGDGVVSAGPCVSAHFSAVFQSVTLDEVVLVRRTAPHTWQIASYEQRPVAPTAQLAARN